MLGKSALQVISLTNIPRAIICIFENVYDMHHISYFYGPAKLRRGTHSYVARHEVAKPLFVAGEEGIEPSHGGTRTHCLTAWLLPKNQLTVNREQST